MEGENFTKTIQTMKSGHKNKMGMSPPNIPFVHTLNISYLL